MKFSQSILCQIFILSLVGACACTLSCRSQSEENVDILAKAISQSGGSVGVTEQSVFVSFGQTLPSGMPKNVQLFYSVGPALPVDVKFELLEIVKRRTRGRIEVFSKQDANDIRQIFGHLVRKEIIRENNSWTVFLIGEWK